MGEVKDDEEARRERARAIGLFRYQLIREAADPDVSVRVRGRMIRGLAAAWHVDPFGRRVRISRKTLDRWVRAWRSGGFDALVPAPRQSAVRTDPEILQLAAGLKRENPSRTTAQVERILRAQTGWSPSHSTLLRHFHRLGLQLPAVSGDTTSVFGRFEADRPNQLWTGDALHGPKIAGRKTYLFAFIDDHSRLLTGYRWGFAEDTVRLAAALRPALAARGIPIGVYVDNGSAFVDNWLLRACASLGIKLTHSTPGRPQGRGKIERVFRTVNEQFLVEIVDPDALASSADPTAGLLELNRLFDGWVEQVYHRRVHSETGQTPLARWHAGWTDAPPATPTPQALREAFLWQAHRRVTKTALISLHGNTYEVDAALVGRRVELVFDPFDLTTIEVRHDGRPMGRAIPHRITRHSHPKARPEIPEPPVPSTGINYLDLVAAAYQAHLGQTINFDALTTPPSPPAPAGTGHHADPRDDANARLDAELASFAALHAHLAGPGHDHPDPDQPPPEQLDLITLLDDDPDHDGQEAP